jgi:hypothetical protein
VYFVGRAMNVNYEMLRAEPQFVLVEYHDDPTLGDFEFALPAVKPDARCASWSRCHQALIARDP